MSNPWIQTYEGYKFDVKNPRLEDISIVDIAHSLSHICRFNGHCKHFYSVAQHSVLLTQQFEDLEVKSLALLHDAAEAYCHDICEPIKSFLIGYDEIENKILDLIIIKFRLHQTEKWNRESDLWKRVQTGDLRMLATERRDLFPPYIPSWPGLDDVHPFPIRIEKWNPSKARLNYLSAFYSLSVRV